VNERMSNAPVYYALAQARFNPISAMSKYVADIQDRLRREGYPLFDVQQVNQLVVPTPEEGAPAEARLSQAASWLITRGDRSAGFILGAEAISYHTTHYETHNEFIPELLRGLNAVHEAVGLDHISRMGLRYLDAVLPGPSETVEQYLRSGLHGVEYAAERQYALAESAFTTDTAPLVSRGTLITRVYRMTSHLGFPPDMFPNGLSVAERFKTKNPIDHAVIDTDHYAEGRMPVDAEQLQHQLLSLHSAIKSVFGAIVTDHARSVWN
jgi:uncharacterized protein (TIGR04255 family)